MAVQLPQYRLPSPSSGLGVPVEDHMTRVRVDSGSRFHSTASVCQHRTLGDCGLIVSFRIRESESSSFVPLHDCFAVQGPPRPVWISACAFLHLKKRGWDVDRDGTVALTPSRSRVFRSAVTGWASTSLRLYGPSAGFVDFSAFRPPGYVYS